MNLNVGDTVWYRTNDDKHTYVNRGTVEEVLIRQREFRVSGQDLRSYDVFKSANALYQDFMSTIRIAATYNFELQSQFTDLQVGYIE